MTQETRITHRKGQWGRGSAVRVFVCLSRVLDCGPPARQVGIAPKSHNPSNSSFEKVSWTLYDDGRSEWSRCVIYTMHR